MIELAPGSIVDKKYAIEKPLGEGGMGVVWLARDINTDVQVVVKAIRAEYAHRKDFRDRTLAEGRALARIDHPNVVRLNAVVSDEDGLFLVMQFIDGESLEDRILRYTEAKTPFSVSEALSIFKQIVQGCAAAHAEGIIHRDMKPANVLLRKKDGAVKVTDFGIAKEEEAAQKGKGQTIGVIGSVKYMSPEQCTGKKDLDKRVDIYALGMLFYELLTGETPFDAESHYEIMTKHVQEQLPPLAQKRPDVPPWIEAIIRKCTEKQRDYRFSSCEELLAALESQGANLTDATAPAAPLPSLLHQRQGPRTEPGAPVFTPAPMIPVHTAQNSSITAGGGEQGKSRGVTIAITIALAAALGLGIAYSLGIFGPKSHDRQASPEREKKHTDPVASSSATPITPVGNEKNPLSTLAGNWRSESGREYEAVLVGDALEMRIRDGKPFAVQGYEEGEARFVLRAISGKKDQFRVEDRLRPNPPAGKEFDIERARLTCLFPYTEVNGKQLEATLDGGKLRVSMAYMQPTAAHFTADGKKVTGCKNLASAPVSPIESVLGRP